MFSDPYELRTGDSRVATRTAPHDLANSTADERDLALLDTLATAHKALSTEIGRRIGGMHSIVDNLVVSILSGGHVILIGVPGLAKTLLIQTLAEALDQSFSRIQFTPDLMPSDITGTELLEEDHGTGKRTFQFTKGPVFASIVLADEINRAPPKTQAALLEAMQEHRVTAANTTYTLAEPFFVLATQNPIEQEGTYPLPEAQLDRFMFNLWLDYPTEQEEMEIVRTTTSDYRASLTKVMDANEICAFQDLVRTVPVADNVISYAVKLAGRTRPKRT